MGETSEAFDKRTVEKCAALAMLTFETSDWHRTPRETAAAISEAIITLPTTTSPEERWRPIDSAPKDGRWIITLSVLTVVEAGKDARFEPIVHMVRRKRSSPESDGYWSSSYGSSIPDSDLQSAVWSDPARVFPQIKTSPDQGSKP